MRNHGLTASEVTEKPNEDAFAESGDEQRLRTNDSGLMLNEWIESKVTIALWEAFRCQRPMSNDVHVDDSYCSKEWIIS